MICVVGDLLLDVFLLDELRAAEQQSGMVLRPGGSAANTAAWLKTLGCPTSFVGSVGDDEIGRALVADLEHRGIRALVQFQQLAETGAVAVEVKPTAERVMRSSRGANALLTSRFVDEAEIQRCRFVHFTGYTLLGVEGMTLLEAASGLARRCGAELAFDPSSPSVIHRFGAETVLRAVTRAGVSHLLPNRAEATALTGADSPTLASSLLASWVPHVFVKTGPDGCVATSGGNTTIVGTDQVAAMDTTGAGDAFNAGVLAGLYSGDDLESACRQGHRAAADVLVQYGGRPGRQRRQDR